MSDCNDLACLDYSIFLPFPRTLLDSNYFFARLCVTGLVSSDCVEGCVIFCFAAVTLNINTSPHVIIVMQ